MFDVVFIVLPFIVFIVGVWSCLVSVSESEVVLLETCGRKSRRIANAGVYFALPWEIVVFRASTRSLLLDTPPINCYTSDRVPVQVDTFVYYRIVDAESAYYGIDNYRHSMKLTVESELGNAVATLRVAEIDNDTLEKALQQLKKNTAFENMGIELGLTKIQSVKHPASLDTATQEQVVQRQRAVVEQQRVEAEFSLEKQKLNAQSEKAQLEQKLEIQRLKAEVEYGRLEQERTNVSGQALCTRLKQLRDAEVLDTYVALEQQETWARIFESEYAPSTLIMPQLAATGGGNGQEGSTMPFMFHMPAMASTTPRGRGRRASVGNTNSKKKD